MEELFKGGPKQQSINGTVNNMNPFKNMVDNMIINESQMRERLENYQGSQSYNDFMMENAFSQSNQMMNRQQGIDNNMEVQNFLQFNNNKKQFIDEENFSQNFNNININTNIQKPLNNPNFSYPQQQFGYGATTMIHPMIQNFNYTVKENETVKKEENKEDVEDNDIKHITRDIIETMANNSHDERFKNSEFLKFITKLHTKEILLEEKSNSVVENKNYKQTFEIIPDSKNKHKVETDVDKMFENIMNEVEENFNSEQDIYEYMKEQSKSETIFQPNNPYLTSKEYENLDLVELAKKLLAEGKTQEAKQVLEAEAQKNGDNTEAWTLLGRIHSENDCDSYAYQCLLRALDVDPFNLDAELALGILCTNEFDELDAMIHLKNWIRLHPFYSKYIDESNPILNEKLIKEAEKTDIDGEDVYIKAKRVEKMRHNFYNEMINMMESIYKDHQNDSNLLISMGIAHFIPSNNERSIQCFRKAVEVDPKDYNAWNKLGAVFAHSKHHQEAINCYKRALDLKPDYVRCWANYGIANYNINNYEEGARCYLKALSICPEIHHIWSYMRSLLILDGKTDYLQLVEQRKLSELCKIYKVI